MDVPFAHAVKKLDGHNQQQWRSTDNQFASGLIQKQALVVVILKQRKERRKLIHPPCHCWLHSPILKSTRNSANDSHATTSGMSIDAPDIPGAVKDEGLKEENSSEISAEDAEEGKQSEKGQP